MSRAVGGSHRLSATMRAETTMVLRTRQFTSKDHLRLRLRRSGCSSDSVAMPMPMPASRRNCTVRVGRMRIRMSPDRILQPRWRAGRWIPLHLSGSLRLPQPPACQGNNVSRPNVALPHHPRDRELGRISATLRADVRPSPHVVRQALSAGRLHPIIEYPHPNPQSALQPFTFRRPRYRVETPPLVPRAAPPPHLRGEINVPDRRVRCRAA